MTPDDETPPDADLEMTGDGVRPLGNELVLLAARAAAEIERQMSMPLAPGLYLVATPIGNLADMTLRALAVLARCNVVYCEDTRHSRTLLAHYGITTRMEAYHDHNGDRERPRLMARLAAGHRIALISDAGTPLVSDPGYKLVREALEAGHSVWSLPGPSAALAGLTSSGLPTDAFLFAGFLPPKSAGRRTRISALASVPASLVFYEAPSRIAACLRDLADVLGSRPAAVARELTKRFETVRRGTLAELSIAFAAEPDPKGEFVIVIAPAEPHVASEAEIEAALEAAMQSMSLRDAAKSVSEALDVAKTQVYELGLKLRARSGTSGED